MIDVPFGGAPEQAPRWDLVDTESCGDGIRFLAPVLIVWGYVGIYIGGRSTSVELRGAHEAGGAPGRVGRTPYLLASCYVPWRRVQVSWVLSVEKITFPKVSFHLDFV